jgi:hypothetical protein
MIDHIDVSLSFEYFFKSDYHQTPKNKNQAGAHDTEFNDRTPARQTGQPLAG